MVIGRDEGKEYKENIRRDKEEKSECWNRMRTEEKEWYKEEGKIMLTSNKKELEKREG